MTHPWSALNPPVLIRRVLLLLLVVVSRYFDIFVSDEVEDFYKAYNLGTFVPQAVELFKADILTSKWVAHSLYPSPLTSSSLFFALVLSCRRPLCACSPSLPPITAPQTPFCITLSHASCGRGYVPARRGCCRCCC